MRQNYWRHHPVDDASREIRNFPKPHLIYNIISLGSLFDVVFILHVNLMKEGICMLDIPESRERERDKESNRKREKEREIERDHKQDNGFKST